MSQGETRALYGHDRPYLKSRTRAGSDVDDIGKLIRRLGWRMNGLEPLNAAHRADLTVGDMQAFSQTLSEHEPTVFHPSAREWPTATVAEVGGNGTSLQKRSGARQPQ